MFTLMRLFYKNLLKKFISSPQLIVKSRAVEGFVSKVLITELSTDLSRKDLSIAVRVLLRATTKRSVEMNKRRVIKDERKQKHRFLLAPHEFLHMINQAENMSNLTRTVSEGSLEDFLRSKANIYLVNYFAIKHL